MRTEGEGRRGVRAVLSMALAALLASALGLLIERLGRVGSLSNPAGGAAGQAEWKEGGPQIARGQVEQTNGGLGRPTAIEGSKAVDPAGATPRPWLSSPQVESASSVRPPPPPSEYDLPVPPRNPPNPAAEPPSAHNPGGVNGQRPPRPIP